MTLDDARREYLHELDRKLQLQSALNLPVTIFALLGTAIVAMVKTVKIDAAFVGWLFLLFTAAAAVALVLTIVTFAWVYFGRLSEVLPSFNDLREYERDLNEWQADSCTTDSEVEPDFQQEWFEMYADAATTNFYRNNRIAETLFRMRFLLIVSAIFTLLAGVCYSLYLVERIVAHILSL